MKLKLNAIGAAVLALSCGAANAAYLITSSPNTTTNVGGVCTVTFDTVGSLSACGPASYSATDGITNHLVNGNSSGQYAQPANDDTQYITVGGNLSAPIVISLGTTGNYFGFYAGSLDSYNSISFSLGANTELTLSGDDINQALMGSNANQSTNAYFNIFALDFSFDTVTLSSSQAAFETDNHSFGTAAPIPEPTSMALLGIGVVGLFAGSRRRSRR